MKMLGYGILLKDRKSSAELLSLLGYESVKCLDA